MVADDRPYLTERESFHQEIMRNIVLRMQATRYVLKGGTALLLTRGLPRHSVDLDFDSNRKVELNDHFRSAISSTGAEILSLRKIKDTDSSQRYKIHYRKRGTDSDVLLRVETGLRGIPAYGNIEVVNGIRTWNIPTIYSQKLDAAENRVKGRDIYDLTFLAKTYGFLLSEEQMSRSMNLLSDRERMIDVHEISFSEDDILSGLTTALDTVIQFRESLESEIGRRTTTRKGKK